MPTTPAPSDPNTAAELPVPLDETLRQAWARHGNLIYGICAVVVVGILAKGGWNYLVDQKELAVRQEYAAAATPESLRAFAANHPGHPLAGPAELKEADDAYASGHYGDAVAGYQKAAADLPAGVFQARARLGQAMSQAQSGHATDAETGLRQLLNDTSQLKAIRCEAGFHLAGLALAAGRAAEVQKLAEQLREIDPASPFAERAYALGAELPEAPVATPPAPAIVVPPKN
jgi:hypothetical protein